jgi:hypothetical protein
MATSTSRPLSMATSCCALATISPPASPSTRSTMVVPASDGRNRIAAVSVPLLLSGRAGSGRVPGVNAGI